MGRAGAEMAAVAAALLLLGAWPSVARGGVAEDCALAVAALPATAGLASVLSAHPPPGVHARCPEAATLLGVALLRAGNIAEGTSHLEAVARAAPPALAWVAAAFLAASLELAARELFAAGKLRHLLPALRAAAAHFSRSAEGRAA